jgi:hypothetical protein
MVRLEGIEPSTLGLEVPGLHHPIAPCSHDVNTYRYPRHRCAPVQTVALRSSPWVTFSVTVNTHEVILTLTTALETPMLTATWAVAHLFRLSELSQTL